MPPPIRPASEMVWCGERNGRWCSSPQPAGSTPAMLWILVVSMASSKVSGGRMPASRLASMLLPEPGGPIIRTLCEPAAATSMRALGHGLPAHIAEIGRARRVRVAVLRSGHARVKLFRPGQQRDHLRQVPHAIHLDAVHHRRFRRVFGGNDHIGDAVVARANRHREGAAHRPDGAIERKFARHQVAVQALHHVPWRPEFPSPPAGRNPRLPCAHWPAPG